MILIDWRGVAIAALWVLGLSLNLAAAGFAHYERSKTQKRWRDIWAQAGYQRASSSGWMLVCLGMLGSAEAWWERLVWAGLAASFGWQAWQLFRRASPGLRVKAPPTHNDGRQDAVTDFRRP